MEKEEVGGMVDVRKHLCALSLRDGRRESWSETERVKSMSIVNYTRNIESTADFLKIVNDTKLLIGLQQEGHIHLQ